MVRGPRQTTQPAIRAWKVWKTSERKQSRNDAISAARPGISWSTGADLRAATILVGFSNLRISRRHAKVRSLLRHHRARVSPKDKSDGRLELPSGSLVE